MSMCSCRLFGELGIRSEELGMFVDGGKEFRGFKVSRDFKEGLRVGRGLEALAPVGRFLMDIKDIE